jgi:hypothetical protein
LTSGEQHRATALARSYWKGHPSSFDFDTPTRAILRSLRGLRVPDSLKRADGQTVDVYADVLAIVAGSRREALGERRTCGSIRTLTSELRAALGEVGPLGSSELQTSRG